MGNKKESNEEKNLETDIDRKMDLVLEKLEKLIFWLRFSNLEVAKEYFEDVLNTDRKKEIYQLTDGRSIADIMKLLKITSKSTIPDLYTDWTEKGILFESDKIKGRKIKVVDLKDIGLSKKKKKTNDKSI